MAILVQSNRKPSVSYPEQTGSIVTFNSQYVGLPLKSHKIALTATQSGSGTPSPDNVRPISGWSAINISQSGADTSTPTVYVINLGGTYYGGEYDARTGLFTVTHMFFTLDYTSNWRTDIMSGLRNFYTACPSDIKAQQHGGNSSMLCSASPISTRYAAQKDHCFISNSKNLNYTWGDTLGIDQPQDFKDYLQANNIVIEVVAELATPTTIQLPPSPIDTLEGVNNIWADTGETTAQYIKIGG